MTDDPRISPRSYGTAVILSAVFGLVGIQHFYLGRWAEGAVDVGLTIAWITCFALGDWAWAAFFFLGDLGHSAVVTLMLLTGNFRDGGGRLVCYPGQKLPPIGPRNPPMRRDVDGLR
jgi:TM2 domain-containing membrane protein YozV